MSKIYRAGQLFDKAQTNNDSLKCHEKLWTLQTRVATFKNITMIDYYLQYDNSNHSISTWNNVKAR